MADEDLDKQENINRSIQERLALLERERSTLLEEADIYKRLLGTNLDLSQIRSRYQSDEKDILQTIRINTNILKDQSKQITFQVAEKSRIQKISNDILNISENSYSMLMEELGTSRNISDIEKKREILAKRLIELESFRGTILFEDKELQASFNEELENSIKGASDLEAQLTDVQNTSEKIQGNVSWFEALKETSNKIGLGKFTSAFEAAEKAARETAVANELSKKVANELVAAKEEEAAAINKITEAEKELQAIKAQEKEDKNKQRELSAAFQKEIEGRKGIAQLTQKELETGEGLTAERLKQLNLSEITGNKTGTAAKELIKQFKAQSQSRLESLRQAKLEASEAKKATSERKKGLTDTLNKAKQEKTLSGNRIKGLKGQQQQLAKMTGKAGMKGIAAGAKALGPILKKAMGPVSILLMVKDVIQFFVDAMFKASKTVAELRQNLGVSSAKANRIRHSFNDIANSGNEFNKTQEGVLILSKQIQQSFGELNTTLSTTIDFTTEFGEEGKSLLRTVSLLRDNFKLSGAAIQTLVKEQIRSGRTAEDINTSVAAEIEFRNQINNTAIDYRQILEDISKLSFSLQGIYGGSTEKLAGAVYEARKLGFELGDLQGAAGNLLDFESSISKELEAELLLGKDLNLEKARQFALNNDMVGVAKELRAQGIDMVKLQQENALAAQAAAEAMGLNVETAVKAQLALEEQLGIERRLAAFRAKSSKELIINKGKENEKVITYQELQNANIKELKDLAFQAQVDFDDLAKVVGEQRIQGLLAEDAQAKFNKALEKAKEQFANLVNSGFIDKLAMSLSRLLDSQIFKKLTGISDEESNLMKGVQKLEMLQSQGVNVDENLIKQGQELLNRINEGEDADKVLNDNLNTLLNIQELTRQTASLTDRDELQKALSENRRFEVSAPIQTQNQNIGTQFSQEAQAIEEITNSGAARVLSRGYGTFNILSELFTGKNIIQHVGEIFTDQARSSTIEESSPTIEVEEVNDAIIRPDKKQIIKPSKQDVIATFKPGGIIEDTLSNVVLDSSSPPPPPPTILDNSEVVRAISLLKEEVNKLNNRPVQVQSTITMDGNNVGTALGMGSYTLGNQI